MLPARMIPKSLVSDRLMIDTVVNKSCDHLPLFRQSVVLERETGLEISRVTLCGWGVVNETCRFAVVLRD